jgi:hypothetical protein
MKTVRLLLGLAALLCATSAGSQNNASQVLAAKANDVMQQRCMVCHGCYDAPCQLKLEASEGLQRGASKIPVYDGERLRAANLTRLFDDGLTEQQWRDKGFFPVIDNENPSQGSLYQMLQLKQAHPLASEGPLPEGFDFSLYRDQQCVEPGAFDEYGSNNPLAGMPYGLPGLDTREHTDMIAWLEDGAPTLTPTPLSNSLQTSLKQWEAFLNQPDNKSRLMSRYLYEHLFLASLYLEDHGEPVWFRLVRSATPPGRNLGLLATRRPFDAPGLNTFYYRLQRMNVTPLAKIHQPYRFDRARLAWYRQQFLETDYEVATLPDYSLKVAGNPFKSFVDIPVEVRYRFLLEDAQFTIMNFIKGPVCRGQIALNVIEDNFWVMFVDPDQADPELNEAFLAAESDNLRLPLPKTGTAIDILSWRRYAKSHAAYQQAKADYMMEQMDREDRELTLNSIWQGDGNNSNASLTIFRHFDTASVVRGFVGEEPKTAWVVNYSLLERIHYLLVASFDVYGSVSHQLESRLYMDFLRMEGELNFLLFLPPEERKKLRDSWYRDARKGAINHVFASSDLMSRENGIEYQSEDPKREFLMSMRERIHGADAAPYDYRRVSSAAMSSSFQRLESNRGVHNGFLPQVSFVNVIGKERDQAFTILRNTGYSNIAQLFQESERRLPEEDGLTLVHGFIGAYPNYFFQVNEEKVEAFVTDIAALRKAEDYDQLQIEYGVPRNASGFWPLSDKFHRMYHQQKPLSAGFFDYNRYSGY